MTKSPIRTCLIASFIVAVVGASGGCGDRRLLEMAEKHLEQQALQQQRLIEQTNRLAEAAKELVAADAQARADLVKLSREIQAERASLDRQREEMEAERRAIAAQRLREPVIAAAMTVIGTMIACLLPLALAAYVLFSARSTSANDDQAVAELLLHEMTSTRPRLFPERVPRIENLVTDRNSAPVPLDGDGDEDDLFGEDDDRPEYPL